MKKSHRGKFVYGLIFAILLCAASGLATTEAAAQVSAASVAGTYEYKTYKKGEGYDNSLDIEDKGSGNLYVVLAGSYIYTNNGNESMHEAEGAGSARLRGNTAIANLKDEADKTCRATITFAANQATIKIPAVCRFNIMLGGVYKKSRAKSEAHGENQTVKAKPLETSFENIDDILNDFDAHRTGEHLIITDVPADRIEKITADDTTYKGLFIVSSNEGGGVTKEFLASAALVKNLKANAEFEPSSLRVTAVITQTDSSFDVYRMSFATKIEGLDENGAVIWTANGTAPARVKFKD